jgi:hypothetical protein
VYNKASSASQGEHFNFYEPVQRLCDVERRAIKLSPGITCEKTTSRAAMEYFGKAVAELLDCSSCYVATLLPNAISAIEEVRIGYATVDPSWVASIERIVRKGAGVDCMLIAPISARTGFVRKLFGPQPGDKRHSVIGRLSVGGGATIVFVAGWRAAAVSSAEMPCVVRAIRMMWSAAQAIVRSSLNQPDLKAWLEDLTCPAFIVNEELLIYEANGRGWALLATGRTVERFSDKMLR